MRTNLRAEPEVDEVERGVEEDVARGVDAPLVSALEDAGEECCGLVAEREGLADCDMAGSTSRMAL